MSLGPDRIEMKWFRFYSEAMHDPKLLRLSDELFRFWVNVLCVANDGNPRGTLPSIEDIGIIMRVKTQKIDKMTGSLVAFGLLDRDATGALRPHGWDSRQQRGDDAAAIKRNQRAKHRTRDGQSDDCPGENDRTSDRTSNGQSRTSPRNVHGLSMDSPPLDTDCPTDRDPDLDTDPDPDCLSTGGTAAGTAPMSSHLECVELAMELFDDATANAVTRSKADLTKKLEGPDGRPWWHAFAAGLRLADRMRRREGAKPIGSVVGLALSKAQEWIVVGEVPPDPVGAEVIAPASGNGPAQGTAASIAEASRKARQAMREKEASDAR